MINIASNEYVCPLLFSYSYSCTFSLQHGAGCNSVLERQLKMHWVVRFTPYGYFLFQPVFHDGVTKAVVCAIMYVDGA